MTQRITPKPKLTGKSSLKPANGRTLKLNKKRASMHKKQTSSIKPAEKTKVVLFNKPFNVLSQFTDDENRATLADYINIKNVYAAGRLDKDSEGLLLLTNNGKLQHKLANPTQKTYKTYWVQVDGDITDEAIAMLSKGVQLKDGLTKPAKVKKMPEPDIWPRNPPVRFRANIPTSWISISICEGRNRQVRRMTAHVGFPTLRLIRYSIGLYTLDNIASGKFSVIEY